MKSLIKALVLVPLLLVFVHTQASSQVTLPEGVTKHIEGFPMMENLAEISTKTWIFDKPEGRILETEIMGQATLASAIEFYQESLKQIGWQVQTGDNEQTLVFVKEGERLTLKFETLKDFVVINVSLAPDDVS